MWQWKKRPEVFLCGWLLTAALSGCVHVEETLRIEKDGSGVIDITYGMTEERAASMQELVQGMRAEAEEASAASMPFGFTEEQIRKDFEAYKESGVELKLVRTETREGWKYRRIVIGFPSLGALAKTGFLSDRNLSLSRDEHGNYVFCQLGESNGTHSTALELDSNGDPQAEANLSKIMKGFRAVIHIETPSRIVETTASERTDRSATWKFDFDQDPNALWSVQAATLRIVFEGKGVKIPEFRSEAGPSR
jgi:hypothetical protein